MLFILLIYTHYYSMPARIFNYLLCTCQCKSYPLPPPGWLNAFLLRKGLSVGIPTLQLDFSVRFPSKKIYIFTICNARVISAWCWKELMLYRWTFCHMPDYNILTITQILSVKYLPVHVSMDDVNLCPNKFGFKKATGRDQITSEHMRYGEDSCLQVTSLICLPSTSLRCIYLSI